MSNSREGILAGLTIEEIEGLPLESVINPQDDPDFQVSVGGARALAYINMWQTVPREVAEFLVGTSNNGGGLAIYFQQWNHGIEGNEQSGDRQQITLKGVVELLSLFDGGQYSPLKEMQLTAASLYIAEQAGAIVFDIY